MILPYTAFVSLLSIFSLARTELPIEVNHNRNEAIKLYSENPNVLRNRFESFKGKFLKSYKSSSEENTRFSIFVENLKIIDSRNMLEPVHGITQFTDLHQEEFERLYLGRGIGVAKKPINRQLMDEDESDIRFFEHRFDESTPIVHLDALIDWTGTLTTPIKDQGYCGSCWAFSAATQIETDAIRTLGYTTSLRLSAAQITQCDTGGYNQGCNGGFTDLAMIYVKNAGGIVSEADYPYSSSLYNGATGSCAGVTASRQLITVSSVGYINPGQETTAMTTYVQYTGPLAIYVAAKTWNSYTGGIMSTCDSSLDHAVQAVGVLTGTGGYWKVRNQWGTSWGEQGYIRLAYGRNICGLASDQSFYAVVTAKNGGNTAVPIYQPTFTPTKKPSAGPTKAPSYSPSKRPTNAPSKIPSKVPTKTPTLRPSRMPTKSPTLRPSRIPTLPGFTTWNPTESFSPTVSPSTKPPTSSPTIIPTQPPSSKSSLKPTMSPTLAPNTVAPSRLPSLGPTETTTNFMCAAYSVSNTNSARSQSNTAKCLFSAVVGSTLTISSCGINNCAGDQYIRLYDASNFQLVASNDDSCIFCSALSIVVSGTPGATRNFVLYEGCFGSTSCGGQFAISGASPNIFAVATATPTVSSGLSYCPAFSASSSGKPVSCFLNICGSESVVLSLCGAGAGTCSGDTTLTLYDVANPDNNGGGLGSGVAYNDDSCGRCSEIRYQSTLAPGVCSVYRLDQSCYTGTCGGSVSVVNAGVIASPSMAPTSNLRPSRRPTQGTSVLSCSSYTYTPGQSSSAPTCTMTLCPGANVYITSRNQYGGYFYGGSCTGDQYISLRRGSSQGIEVANNDDRCSSNYSSCLCSELYYTVPNDGSVTSCQIYTLVETCSVYQDYPTDSCGGKFVAAIY